MIKDDDIIGKTFNELIVIKKLEDDLFLCYCSCGKLCHVKKGRILRGETKSCGHLKQNRGQWKWKNNYGLSNTHIYRVWKNMMSRCYKPNNIAYKNYGERGITVCDDWHDLLKFISWALENDYKKGFSLDRKDYDKGYCAENCAWVERKEQGKNKRNNIMIEYHGKVQTLTDWAIELKIPYGALYHRICIAHWDIATAFTKPSQKH